MPTNDNDAAGPLPAPDLSNVDGHAALLLVESLIHGLCEKKTLSAVETVDIVDRAADVQFAQAEAADGAGAPMWRAHELLRSIAASLRIDVVPPPPRLAT